VYSNWPTMTLDAVTFGKDFDISFDWYAADRNQFKMGAVSIGFDQGTTWGTGLRAYPQIETTFRKMINAQASSSKPR